ncbi:MAG: undecaprenyldiphospho-muramoylpentapeptide beta-N-acetylglucosaminyltransferase [Myxococcales bacterium]|nr:undecaprenyldiphospho-muramoylpentapeptide beta-N-acetylglucosaminyltransferase [Myxococcales bacterium]
MIDRMIVAGGGTGGHLFPGLAVVEELRRRSPRAEVRFVGTRRGIEARVLPERGERVDFLDVTPLKGRSGADLAKSVGRLPQAFGEAARLLRDARPDVVLGVGGYASGPLLATAAAMGLRTALLEQNAHVGLTNRLLAPLVGRAYVTFDETREVFGAGRARLAGNPIRRAFVEAARDAVADPDGLEARARTVLVLGGSQGAKSLNVAVPNALASVGLAERGLRVVHQTGMSMRDEVADRYAALGVDAEVLPFIDDVARAYANATLVIARAGATTLSELCAIGRASILVPFPHAADDHQRKNADALEAAGAARAIDERELTEARLVQEVTALLDDPARRLAMAAAARTRGRPDAAARIVDDLCAWVAGEGADFAADASADRPEVARVTAPASRVAEAAKSSLPSARGGQAKDRGRPSSLRGGRAYVPRPMVGLNGPACRATQRPRQRRRLVVGDVAWE